MEAKETVTLKRRMQFGTGLRLLTLIASFPMMSALLGCTTAGIGFDRFPDGSPVPGDSTTVSITDQFAEPEWTGFRPTLSITPPEGAALIPVATPDARSAPNVLCLVLMDGYENGATEILLGETTNRAWITVTSGEPTIELVALTSEETIATLTVGVGRHVLRPDKEHRGFLENTHFNRIRILAPADEDAVYCIDDIRWLRM